MAKSTYPQGGESLRHFGEKTRPRSDLAPSRSRPKTAGNLRLSAVPWSGETGCEETDWSGRRDSNPRPQPWQGCALPLSYARASSPLRPPGAIDGVRTRDLRHHKPALYQLSYERHPERRDLSAAESHDPCPGELPAMWSLASNFRGLHPVLTALHLRKPPGRTFATRCLIDLGIRDNEGEPCSSCPTSYRRPRNVSTRFSKNNFRRAFRALPRARALRRRESGTRSKNASTEKKGFPYGSSCGYNPVSR